MIRFILFIQLVFLLSAEGQPVSVEEAGVKPLTDNLILHQLANIPMGGRVENPGVAILDNRRIVVCWEDDYANMSGQWLMLDERGKLLTHNFRSFLKPDGQRPELTGHFAPLVHANLFGKGFLFGVTYFDWKGSKNPQNRIPEYAERFDVDDAPVIQRISSKGEYIKTIINGFPPEFTQRKGRIRLAEAGYLSNGNIVVVAEDQQLNDGPELFQLPNAMSVVIASILQPDGKILYGPIVVQQSNCNGYIWNGLAIGNGHFGVLYQTDWVKMRFFDNELKPITLEIPIEKALLNNISNANGRGDASGWHGNSRDDYLLSVMNGRNRIIATVFTSQGKRKFDPVELNPAGVYAFDSARCDGAIDEQGNFAAVGACDMEGGRNTIVARFFNADGTPKTPPFFVTSVKPEDWAGVDQKPRIAMRNGLCAIVWHDANTNLTGKEELALRIFKSPFVSTPSPAR